MNSKLLQIISNRRSQATHLIEQGRCEKAVEMLLKYHRQWPEFPMFLTDLSTAYFQLFDFENAGLYLRKLLKRHGNRGDVLTFVGDMYASMRQIEPAMKVYEQLLIKEATNQSAGLRMTALLERQGHLGEASESLERVLHHQRNSEEGRFLKAVLLTRGNQLEEAGQLLYDLLSSGLSDREIQWKAGYQLAAVFDKQGNHSDAIQVLVATKQGMENDYAREIKAARDAFQIKCHAIRKMTTALTSDDVARWREDTDAEYPVALLAGHPRSGTTLLESILERHSGLVSVEETTCMENQVYRSVFGVPAAKPDLFHVEFLDQVSSSKRRQAHTLYQKALSQFLPASGNTSLILDKNPMLTHFMGIALRFFPSMKSLVALRDPRAVCLSCFQQPVGVNTSNVSWLRIDDTMKAYNDIMGVWLKLRQILPDGWLEVRYEELVVDTETIAHGVVDFLGLKRESGLMDQDKSKRTIFSPTYAQADQAIYRSALERWKAYEDFLNPHLNLIHPSVKALGY